MTNLSQEDQQILHPYISNIDSNVFVAQVPGLTGAIFARYSRASGGFREVMLNEFIKAGQLDVKKADSLIERILIAFGDDSVGELEGVHLSIEQISNLATKIIEDKRIGGSPIEQSSRYVFYDQRNENGNFKFLREPRIMVSEYSHLYETAMNFFFETYCSLIEPMQTHFRSLLPISEAEFKLRESWDEKKRLHELTGENEIKDFERTYREMIRTKACDTIRVVLPAATLTNVGVFGNGRFFQGLLTELYSSQFTEMRELAPQIHRELNKFIKRYVQRAKPNDYLSQTREDIKKLAQELFSQIVPEKTADVTLLDNPNTQKEFLDFTIANALFPFLEHPTTQIRRVVSQYDRQVKEKILKAYNGQRKSKRDRPGRGLEFGYPITLDLVGNFGIYRDLHRHRMLTQQRQNLTTNLGFTVPQEIKDASLEEKVLEAEQRSRELFKTLKSEFPEEAQLVTLFGHKIRWNIGMNPREAMHLLELRTIPQGHSDYRKVCQQIHKLLKERDPEIAELMAFVDYNNYPFARADSEAKIRTKEYKLNN